MTNLSEDRGGDSEPKFGFRLFLLLLGGSAALRDLQVGGFHAFTILCLLLAAFHAKRPPLTHPGGLTAAWVTGASCLVASTVLIGAYVNYPLLGGQLIALTASAITLGLCLDLRQIREVFRGFLLVTTGSSFFALLQQFRVVNTELYVDYSGLERPTGFVAEPDWVAAFAVGATAVLMGRIWERSNYWKLAIVVNVGATIFCLARGSWLALLAVALFAMFAQSGVRVSRTRLVAFAAIVAGAIVSGPLEFATTARTRLLSIFVAEHRDENTSFRQAQIDALVELVRTAPWYGHGLSAQGRVSINGVIRSESLGGGVSTNWILGLLADGGLLAVPLIGVLLVLVWRHRGSPQGLLLLALLVNSLFSNLLFVPAVWLAVGACVALDNAVRVSPGFRHHRVGRLPDMQSDRDN